MKKPYLLFAIFFLLFNSFSHAAAIDFIKGDLENLKAQAARENKPFFVSFTASWCLPCRQMEKTTYTDPDLAYYVSKYYLAGKVDVDDFDGYNYKVEYNVDVMPTLIIFSAAGKPVARIEQSMSATTMKSILAKFNTSPQQYVPVAPPVASVSKPAPNYSQPVTNTMSRPALKPKPKANPAPAAYYQPNRPVATGQGLYKLSVTEQNSSGFAIQLGMFEDYDNLLAEVSRLDQLLKRQILVHIDTMNGRKVYKVLVGDFKTKERAIVYQNTLRKEGLAGFIKDLSLMK